MKRPKQTAWSYSRLSAYELCPMKYQQESVTKKYPFVANEASDFGVYAHKAFELRFAKDKELPLDLQHHEKYLIPIMQLKGTPMVEQKMALNADFEPTGFFDSDVWVRAIVDLTKIDTGTGLIVDWKFGKRYIGFDQVDLMFAVLCSYLPNLEQAVGAYYWAKEKAFDRQSYTRSDLPAIWSRYLPRVAKYDKAHKEINFPAKPNFLCKNWCPVKDCKHWGI